MEKMRKFSQTWFAKAFLALIFLSFMSWGITGYIFGMGGKRTALTIGETDISLASLAEEVKRQKMQLEKIMGQAMPKPFLEDTMIVEQVMQNMTARILLDYATHNLQLFATNEFVFAQIQSQKEFHQNGQFSPELFQQILNYNGISEKNIFAETANQHTRYLLRSSLESVFSIPDTLVNGLAKYEGQMRSVAIQNFRNKDISLKKKSTETDLIQTYEQNKHLFIQPEYRQISYLIIKPEHAKGDKEKLLVLAEDIENDLIGGASFSEVASKFNISFGTFPLLDISGKTKYGKSFSTNLFENSLLRQGFSIDEGLETNILKSGNDFVLLRPTKVIEAAPLSFSKVKAQVKEIWEKKERDKESYIQANMLLKKINETGKFERGLQKVTRKSSLDPRIISKIFFAKEGDTFIAKTETGSTVVKVKSIKNQEFKKNSSEYKHAKNILRSQLNAMIMDDYMGYLSDKYGVEKEDKLIIEYFTPKSEN
ncbi:MAG: peptidylprolyl isomerase [Alphaproteobacteria bacterium]